MDIESYGGVPKQYNTCGFGCWHCSEWLDESAALVATCVWLDTPRFAGEYGGGNCTLSTYLFRFHALWRTGRSVGVARAELYLRGCIAEDDAPQVAA